LEKFCGIGNHFHKKAELSSDFIYRMIEKLGGPDEFYSRFHITSVCPLGFIKDGVNVNYYDDKELLSSVDSFIHKSVKRQLEFGCRRDVAFIVGEGKNLELFSRWNDDYGYFDKLIGLPHPRFIMQYKRKKMDQYLEEYSEKLSNG
ncbi:MAG: uracil-DNA glycosylase family protein, partial [Bacteroidota bacterium]